MSLQVAALEELNPFVDPIVHFDFVHAEIGDRFKLPQQ